MEVYFLSGAVAEHELYRSKGPWYRWWIILTTNVVLLMLSYLQAFLEVHLIVDCYAH